MTNDVLSSYAVNNTPVNAGIGKDPKATNRGWFSVFNKAATAKEDWQRAQQAADNDFYRNLALQDHTQAFNASEAEKAREWEKMMSDTSYQRAVEDLQSAGLNPILAYSNGGASTPTGASASSGSGGVSSHSAGSLQPHADMLGNMMKFASGLISSAQDYEKAMNLANGVISQHRYNSKGKLITSTVTHKNAQKWDDFGRAVLKGIKSFIK